MSQKIDVPIDDVRRVFELLGKLNAMFHQPLKYTDPKLVKVFAEANYPEISDLYYNIVWKWLPEDIKAEIEDG